MRVRIATLSIALAATAALADARAGVHEAFRNPPEDAKLQIWYHWLGEHVNEEALVRDIAAMHEMEISTFYIFTPDGDGDRNAVPMSPGWLHAFETAIRESKKYGMKIGFHNCPGWTSSGGPWITPENSMKYVVSSCADAEAAADGSLAATLAQPKTNQGFYRDIAAYAFPIAKPVAPSSSPIPHLFKVKETGTSESVELSYPEPIEPKYFLFRTEKALWKVVNCDVTVEAWADGAWTKLGKGSNNYHNRTYENRVLRLEKTVRADRFRITVTSTPTEPWIKPADVEITSAELSALPYVPDILRKNSGSEAYGYVKPADPDERGLDPSAIVDAGRFLSADGSFRAPAGTFGRGFWRVVRIGYTSTGEPPHPSTIGGLECDKLDRRGVEAHWKAMPEKVLALPGAKETVRYVVVDSYEVGGQNWTEILPAEFRKRRGREIGKDLLAVCGYTVGTAGRTADFLWEWQQVISDLFAENYYDRFTELCHEAGVKSVLESYGGPFDSARCGASADVPSGEFWLGRRSHRSFQPMQKIVRDYGKRILAAEAFTTETAEGRWLCTPAIFREAGEGVGWINGINRLVVHSYIHQPFLDKVPGRSMGRHGSQFNRNTTWWRDGHHWSRYVARGQALLQYGRPGLETDGVPAPVAPKSIRTVRREGPDGERVYFAVNDSDEPFFGTVAFAAPAGTAPELFNAVDGTIAAAPNRPGADGFTEVHLDIPPRRGAFVVFSRGAKREAGPIPEKRPAERVLADVSRDWTIVSFEGLAAPSAPVGFDRLASWTESSDEKLRHFSGRAVYERRVTVGEEGSVLDLGEVHEIANVFVDGKKVACLWDAPYRTRIPAGEHVLRVEVVNTWPNRLIGDAVARKAGKPIVTWTNWQGWFAEDKLLPAGLMGPVRILKGRGE